MSLAYWRSKLGGSIQERPETDVFLSLYVMYAMYVMYFLCFMYVMYVGRYVCMHVCMYVEAVLKPLSVGLYKPEIDHAREMRKGTAQ